MAFSAAFGRSRRRDDTHEDDERRRTSGTSASGRHRERTTTMATATATGATRAASGSKDRRANKDDDGTSYESYQRRERYVDRRRDGVGMDVESVPRVPASYAVERGYGAYGGGASSARFAHHGDRSRDQFLTSAMLCVGAVSVCLVSVMIAGGLAFVGLAENHRDHGMDFVRNGNDAWTSSGGYRSGDAFADSATNGQLFASSRGGMNDGGVSSSASRYDYFAQPDRLDQDKLIDELDKRYGERLQAMMRALQSGQEDGSTTLMSQRRGDDPSFLPPAPMTEEEREAEAQAERLRRLPHERLPEVEDDEDEEERHHSHHSHHSHHHHHEADADADADGDLRRVDEDVHADNHEHHQHAGILSAEEDVYAKIKHPSHIVQKARERFEQNDNTQQWHAKIREDADKYIERLQEIRAIVAHGSHRRAMNEIKLGVEAVRQWHATISKDLKQKVAAMEVALQKITEAKGKDPEVRVSALTADIGDELDALTTSSSRMDELRSVMKKLIAELSDDHDADAQSTSKSSSSRHSRDANSADIGSEEPTHDLEERSPEDVAVMKKWTDGVTKHWVKSSDDPRRHSEAPKDDAEVSGGDAPWVHNFAALGSAANPSERLQLGVNVVPGNSLADVLQQIVDVIMNVTDALDGKTFTFDGHQMNVTLRVNSSEVEQTMPELGHTIEESLKERFESKFSTPKAKKTHAALGASAPEKPKKRSMLARLGAAWTKSWGSNEWTGTDAEDATWNPIHGEDDGVYVGDDATKISPTLTPEQVSLAASRGGDKDDDDEDAVDRSGDAELEFSYSSTPSPDDEQFESKSKKRVMERYAKAEHESAEAWREEAQKAQAKLEELAAKGLNDDEKVKKSASAVESMKGMIKEFKKALLKETKARARVEKELEETRAQADEDQEDLQKRVVEQAKLQILAARAEARDASLARIKAEEEVEKLTKEKEKISKAAAKVQASADKALDSMMHQAQKPQEPQKPTVSAEESAEEYEDLEKDVAPKTQKPSSKNKATQAVSPPVNDGDGDSVTRLLDVGVQAVEMDKEAAENEQTTWDKAYRALDADLEREGDNLATSASKSAHDLLNAEKKKSSSSKKSNSDDDGDDDDEKSTHLTFKTAIGFKKTTAISKMDVKLVRSAVLSLLEARAPGACSDGALTAEKDTDDDGNVLIKITCTGVKSKQARGLAKQAMSWAFESDKFAANLEKIGFSSASPKRVYLQRDDA